MKTMKKLLYDLTFTIDYAIGLILFWTVVIYLFIEMLPSYLAVVQP